MTSYLNIYWLWKPYIIKKTMEMMDDDMADDGDILSGIINIIGKMGERQ